MNHLPLILALLTIATLVGYAIGYATAWAHHQVERARYNAARLQWTRDRNNMANWIRENWPTEFDAYTRGAGDGYQQGVLQGPDLKDAA